MMGENPGVTMTMGYGGLSKRELIAAMAMQGIAAGMCSGVFADKAANAQGRISMPKPDAVAETAVRYADALLAALAEGGK